jgi:2Fe-2S ferredoxin
MSKITVILRDDETRVVEAVDGLSVMEAIRNAGIDEIVALCGGSCSCATCHVFVEAGAEALPPPASDERDMLEASAYQRDNSRLSCQLTMSPGLEGLTVRIAPEE